MLHSGARYAVTDQESARECISENQILRKIASHCVDETDGFFISLPDDDLSFQAKFVESCQRAGIRADVLDPKEALSLEPSMNSAVIGAVRVPDGSIDPFRLTASNIRDAKTLGATVLTYHKVTELIRRQDAIVGVKVLNVRTKETTELYAPIVVNACGIWGAHVAEMAGVKISMFPAKGALLIYGHRVNKIVLNRCRKPSDADILVPGDTICLIGTTSTKVPFDSVDNMYVLPEEVEILRKGAQELSPILEQTRILRCYAGVRPLVASDNDPSGRSVSRGIVLFDHVELVTRFIYRMVNESKAFDLSKLKFKQRERPLKIAYHTPCHLEKLGWEYYSIELLRMIPNIDITVLKPNCCGIGGTYGFKKENYENAQKIGEPLFREIEEGGFDLVVSDCETCKWQIEMSTSLKCKHPVTVFAEALEDML